MSKEHVQDHLLAKWYVYESLSHGISNYSAALSGAYRATCNRLRQRLIELESPSVPEELTDATTPEIMAAIQ